MLLCLSLCVVSEMKEHQSEEKQPNQHRERTHVVRIGRIYEPFVLRVLEWTYRHLGGAEEVCVADSIVVHLELEHTINVR